MLLYTANALSGLLSTVWVYTVNKGIFAGRRSWRFADGSGDIVSILTSRDLGAGERLDLARLDDDGAPAAADPPRGSDSRGPQGTLAGPPAPRLRFDPALIRPGAVDGGWWPYSRAAVTELPALVTALQEQAGVRVQRLSVPRDEWDDIPARLTVGGRLVRVDWFVTMPRNTVSVTAASRGPIELLVVPPGTPPEAAQGAMDLAATSPGTAQAAEILAAEVARRVL